MEASHTTDYHSKHSYASYVGRYTNINILHALKEINNDIYLISGKEKADIDTIIENYVYYNGAIETTLSKKQSSSPIWNGPRKHYLPFSYF